MKTAALLLALAALTFAGCGGSEDDSEPNDFDTIEKASGFSAEASDKADLAIEALGQGDIETATARIDEATELAQQTQETLEQVESEPTRRVFDAINRLTLEGYDVLGRGILAAGRGDEKATDRYAKESIEIRDRKLQLLNSTDFEAGGAGDSNEKVREMLLKQLLSEAHR